MNEGVVGPSESPVTYLLSALPPFLILDKDNNKTVAANVNVCYARNNFCSVDVSDVTRVPDCCLHDTEYQSMVHHSWVNICSHSAKHHQSEGPSKPAS